MSSNPYAPTTNLSGNAAEDLEKQVDQLIRHANRVWMSLIGVAFLGLLGPPIYTLVFVSQTRRCDELIQACDEEHQELGFRLREAKSKFRSAALFYGVLLLAELAFCIGIFFV